MREGLAANGEADKSKACNGSNFTASDDPDKRDAVKGYQKLTALVFLFAALLLFRINVFDVVTVAGHSMDDYLLEGDVLIIRKFDMEEIDRYDIVVAKTGKQKVIKRVIGLPWDTVQIADGVVLINGEVVDEEFNFFTDYEGLSKEPFVLGEDEYFLLGDNRAASWDSRDFGAVSQAQLLGVAAMRILPLWRIQAMH